MENDLKVWYFSVVLYRWYSLPRSVVGKQILTLYLNSSINHIYILKFFVINLHFFYRCCTSGNTSSLYDYRLAYTRHPRARDVSCRILLCTKKAIRLHGIWSIATAGWDTFRFLIRAVPYSEKLCWLTFIFVLPSSSLNILGMNGEYGL